MNHFHESFSWTWLISWIDFMNHSHVLLSWRPLMKASHVLSSWEPTMENPYCNGFMWPSHEALSWENKQTLMLSFRLLWILVLLETEERLKLRSIWSLLVDTCCDASSLVDVLELCPVALGTFSLLVVMELCPIASDFLFIPFTIDIFIWRIKKIRKFKNMIQKYDRL